MSPIDARANITTEQIQGTTLKFLKYFAGEAKPAELDRYQRALVLATQLAINFENYYDYLENGDARATFREAVAYVVSSYITDERKPPPTPKTNPQLAADIGSVLDLYAAKAAYGETHQDKKTAWLKQLTEVGLNRDPSNQGVINHKHVQTREFAEMLVYTAAKQLATKELQQQTQSSIPVV